MGTTYIFPTTYDETSNVLVRKRVSNTQTRNENISISNIVNLVKDAGYDGFFLVGETNDYRFVRVFNLTGINEIYCSDENYPDVPAGYNIGTWAGANNNFSPANQYYITVDNTLYASGTSNQNNIVLGNKTYYGWSNNNVTDAYPTILCLIDFEGTVYLNDTNVTPSSDIIGTGGGATHIAKVTGLLSTLSSNLSDILAVAGGGGGGLISNETPTTGANGGGISGSGSNSADQSTGYGFGQGESSGGGSGLYGGYKSANGDSGGAGSGYIGNSLLSNKKMVGYNVPTSSAEGTKTESVNTYSAEATANTPKSGNGHARITWLRNI